MVLLDWSACWSDKSWSEASGKTGSEKKFYRNVNPGADFTAPRELEVIAREQVANVELTLTFEGECWHDTTQPAHFNLVDPVSSHVFVSVCLCSQLLHALDHSSIAHSVAQDASEKCAASVIPS